MTFTSEPLFRDPKAKLIVVLHFLDLLKLCNDASVLGFVEAFYNDEPYISRLHVRNLTFECGGNTFRAYIGYC